MKKLILLIIFLSFCFNSYSQERKNIEAYRFSTPPLIDGKLNEKEWQKIKPASNFEIFKPTTRFGKKIPKGYESFVYFGYDDKAVYLAADFKHPNPKEIRKQFSKRDVITGFDAEGFWVSLDTNDDKQSHFTFLVTTSGALSDLYADGGWDSNSTNYDTVFDSKYHINDDGWTAEMIIPYSAIRFPKKQIQDWGINFGRDLSGELKEEYMWNPVDLKNESYEESMGLVKNIQNIDPPVRLFFYPYLQSAVNIQKSLKPSSSYSAGLDLKYGLSNSFTLDLTLIPDFGQVSFDDRELNLSPFEQQFSEKRAFFTEGADLFKKADGRGPRSGGPFFYSRRIGQEINFNENDYLNDDEEILSYDEKPDLINSLKVTGTTDGKLSIGFLNAVTAKAFAYIKNTNDNSTRKVEISPLTNYNVISLSQQFLNDFSSISFLNTNVNRSSGPNANSSAIVFDIYDKRRKYNFNSKFFQSYAPRLSEKKGFRATLTFRELKGKFKYTLMWGGMDRYYNQNELGLSKFNNLQRFNVTLNYQILKENRFFRSYNSYLSINERYRFNEFDRTGGGFRFGNNFTLQNLIELELDFEYAGSEKDFFEPRVRDRYVIDPGSFGIKFGLKTNTNNIFSYGFEYENNEFNNKQFDENKHSNSIMLSAKYRISNQITLNISTQNENVFDDVGFLKKKNNNIYFGKRKIKSIENNIDFEYNINPSKFLSLKFRNFWSSAKFDEILYNLLENGKRSIIDYDLLDYDPNTNFNLWNLELNYEWWFSPGSTLTVQYKNQIFNRDNKSGINYYESLKELFEIPVEHQFSLRVNYLIDYNKLRRKRGVGQSK